MTEQSSEKPKRKYFAITRKRILIVTIGILLLISLGKLVTYEVLAASQLRKRVGQRIVFPVNLAINHPSGSSSWHHGSLRSVRYGFSGSLGLFQLELYCDRALDSDDSVAEFVVGVSPREALDVLIITNKLAGTELDDFTNRRALPSN